MLFIFQARTQWEKIEHKGKWDPQSTAGGPPISFLSKKFWSNPQFELHVAAVDHPTTVVISLFEVQEYLRREENDISIGFSIFQVSASDSGVEVSCLRVFMPIFSLICQHTMMCVLVHACLPFNFQLQKNLDNYFCLWVIRCIKIHHERWGY